MDTIDACFKKFRALPEVFASLFNNAMFDGEALVHGETLTDLNTDEIHINADNPSISEKRQRDVLKKGVCKQGQQTTYLLLAAEGQSYLDISMSGRTMLYDAINIMARLDDLRERNKQSGNALSGECFLSKLHEDDRIEPIFTLVVYLSAKRWPAKLRSVCGLFRIPPPFEKFRARLPQYTMNLLEPCRLSDEKIERFQSDLAAVLYTAKYMSNKKRLLQIIHEKSIFQDVNYHAACLIRALCNWNIKLPEKEETVNMTSQTISLSEWCIAEGKKEGIKIGERRAQRRATKKGKEQGLKLGMKMGIEQGIEQGIAQGIAQGIVGSVKALDSVGISKEEICRQLMTIYHLSQEQANRYIADTLE
ncbi:MAG: Rpn family recombination-promoting nuclease/putative transposase [Victivallales bacterium]|nr:Rpn family recombination-promoting nuclease/putative transposase [Victivallales bacterium]